MQHLEQLAEQLNKILHKRIDDNDALFFHFPQENGNMFVQCLGSGDAFGSGGRLNTSFYLRTEQMGILLDCGASTLIALRKQRLTPEDIDLIVITHFHGDHFGGLAFVLCEIIALGTRQKPLTIIGPQGVEERTNETLACLFPGIRQSPVSQIIFRTYLAEIPITFLDIRLTAYRAVHSPQTNPHSLRIQTRDVIVAYSGDTAWSEELIKVSMNADLFICEGSTWQTKIEYHLSIKEVLAELHRLQAKRIVLTHLGEQALQHKDELPLAIAEDGMILLDT